MIKYIILDVDGTLTDSGVYYDSTGNELKKFSTKDGTGIICAREAGITVLVLTGRECAATDKAAWLETWMRDEKVEKSDVGYIGDDINDLAPMKYCGYIGCPADAAAEVKAAADYISPLPGGHGAVRDVIEHILRENGLWENVVNRAYGAGI